jgi:hypothetical protein
MSFCRHPGSRSEAKAIRDPFRDLADVPLWIPALRSQARSAGMTTNPGSLDVIDA